MLVLSRREGETIQIGKDIVIHLTRIKGNRVNIGIQAPDSERILRGELAVTADCFDSVLTALLPDDLSDKIANS